MPPVWWTSTVYPHWRFSGFISCAPYECCDSGLKQVMVASFQIFSDSSFRITYHCTLKGQCILCETWHELQLPLTTIRTIKGLYYTIALLYLIISLPNYMFFRGCFSIPAFLLHICTDSCSSYNQLCPTQQLPHARISQNGWIM